MTSEPLVSVLMNCYNGERYLREAIDSVRAQTYQNWEIIFWDNQSTDGSAAIVNSYDDSRLRYFRADTHTQLYEARCLALEKAAGDFIAFLDVDDRWASDKLMRQLPLFDDPEVGIVCSNHWYLDEATGRRWKRFDRPLPTGWVLASVLESYFVGLLTLVVRRTALASLDRPFDKRFHIIGDMDLVTRLVITWKLDAVQVPLATFRHHDRNESTKHRHLHLAELKMWASDLSRIPEVARLSSYRVLLDNITAFEAVTYLITGDHRPAAEVVRRMRRSPKKVRLLLALALPAWVVRRVRDFSR